MSEFYLQKEFAELFDSEPDFAQMMALTGKIFRQMDGRKTLEFRKGERAFFAKLHFGVGWREIFKNLTQGRLPVLGARQEWQAVQYLQQLNVPTMTLAAYGERGLNPAKRHSFVITQSLNQHISLEDYCGPWPARPPSLRVRRQLIEAVARSARVMHENGMNHRDFYLCHFLLDKGYLSGEQQQPVLHLIDLHRAQIRTAVPRRWLVKDLGALYFSALDVGLSRRDVLRFLRHYSARPLRQLLADQEFWGTVVSRADSMYRKMWGKAAVFPLR